MQAKIKVSDYTTAVIDVMPKLAEWQALADTGLKRSQKGAYIQAYNSLIDRYNAIYCAELKHLTGPILSYWAKHYSAKQMRQPSTVELLLLAKAVDLDSVEAVKTALIDALTNAITTEIEADITAISKL